MRVGIYARVSTSGQTVENQIEELRAVADRLGWTIAAVFVDHAVSGAKGRDQRPEFDRLLKAVTRRQVDLVAAWSVDRLGRSLQDLVTFLATLQARNVGLFLLVQGLDTTTPAGRALFGMLSVFAEFERALVVERVRSGLRRAVSQGKRLGRPPMDREVVETIRTALQAGGGIHSTAKRIGVGVGTVQRVRREIAAQATLAGPGSLPAGSVMGAPIGAPIEANQRPADHDLDHTVVPGPWPKRPTCAILAAGQRG